MSYVMAKIPKALLKYPDRIERAIENFTVDRAEDIRIDFMVTVQTWRNKPRFNVSKIKDGRLIWTDSKIYLYVSGGTRPHKIRARRVPLLRFYRTGFRPKTRIGYIGSNKGRQADKDLTKVKEVWHPGNQARGFEKVIAEKWKKRIPALLQAVFKAEIAKILRETV